MRAESNRKAIMREYVGLMTNKRDKWQIEEINVTEPQKHWRYVSLHHTQTCREETQAQRRFTDAPRVAVQYCWTPKSLCTYANTLEKSWRCSPIIGDYLISFVPLLMPRMLLFNFAEYPTPIVPLLMPRMFLSNFAEYPSPFIPSPFLAGLSAALTLLFGSKLKTAFRYYPLSPRYDSNKSVFSLTLTICELAHF